MKRLLTTIALVSLTIFSFADEKEKGKASTMKSVSFTVVDANNESIAGAEVLIESLGLTTYTDMEGNYTVEIPSNTDEEIKISFISFEDKVVNINNIENGKITLREE